MKVDFVLCTFRSLRFDFQMIASIDYFLTHAEKEIVIIWLHPYISRFSTVPGYMVGESELEASKEGRNLSDFKYSCVGYSVFMENKDDESEKGEKQTELPFCVGIEVNIFTELLLAHAHSGSNWLYISAINHYLLQCSSCMRNGISMLKHNPMVHLCSSARGSLTLISIL